MNHPPSFRRLLTLLLCGCVLCLCLVLAKLTPASAADTPRSAGIVAVTTTPPLGTWYAELGRRDRVVQLCVLTGALALFVIMKKLSY
jgi:hypothetical protein